MSPFKIKLIDDDDATRSSSRRGSVADATIEKEGGKMTVARRTGILWLAGTMIIGVVAGAASAKAQQPSSQGHEASSAFGGVLGGDAASPEISTAELIVALEGSGAIIFDARPYEEYAVSHIPGARTVPGKPGTTPALYVADASEVAKSVPDKGQSLILYCNGLYCGRSERFAEDLIKLGYQNVSRYQLGAPAWRALGGVMQVEKPALLRLLAEDKTSVLIDGRTAEAAGRLHGAVSIPLADASKAKDDGRLPMTDHNTRIFVVASNGAEARKVAEAIVHDAFHNVTFFGGTATDLPELLDDESGNANTVGERDRLRAMHVLDLASPRESFTRRR